MARARTLLAALVACGLLSCALGAGGASAAGLTAYVCEAVSPGTGEYADSHCEEEGEGNYATLVVPENETTEASALGEGPATLSATLGGVRVTVTCTGRTGSGDLRNVEEGGVMRVHGTNIVIEYTGCSGAAGAKQKPCAVTGVGAGAGAITTAPLTSTATAEGAVHHAVFEPEEGGNFTEFVFGGSECPSAVQNGGTPYPITGSLTGTIPESAQSHLTFQGTGGGNLRIGEGAEAEYQATTSHLTMAGTEETIAVKTS
jgi:hypothetical protein